MRDWPGANVFSTVYLVEGSECYIILNTPLSSADDLRMLIYTTAHSISLHQSSLSANGCFPLFPGEKYSQGLWPFPCYYGVYTECQALIGPFPLISLCPFLIWVALPLSLRPEGKECGGKGKAEEQLAELRHEAQSSLTFRVA